MRKLRLALAQINPTVGDFVNNVGLIVDNIEQARLAGADVIAFPELAIPGYPPEDLVLKPKFIDENRKALDKVIAATAGVTVICGFVDRKENCLYNAAAIIH